MTVLSNVATMRQRRLAEYKDLYDAAIVETVALATLQKKILKLESLASYVGLSRAQTHRRLVALVTGGVLKTVTVGRSVRFALTDGGWETIQDMVDAVIARSTSIVSK